MSHPPLETIEPGAPPWKDHSYVGFWDPAAGIYGFVHFSGSPNAATKAQICVRIGDKVVDVIDPLRSTGGRFVSDSADFDLRDNLVIDCDGLSGRLTLQPRFVPADYTAPRLLPALVADEPLNHYQQGLSATGEFVLDNVTHPVDALGFRSRTWGFRDDSAQFVEHSSVFACFEDRDVTAMKFRWPDGSLRAAGAVLTDTGATPIVDYRITRDRVGLLKRAALVCADGDRIDISRTREVASFWCPIDPPKPTDRSTVSTRRSSTCSPVTVGAGWALPSMPSPDWSTDRR